tara:strand:+ start:19849 stop:21948 length:2100 start_codon:yes stop_codon:yes gene_type:complete
MKMRLVLGFCAMVVAASAADWSKYYTIENIPLPEKVDHQIGGLSVLRDGRIAACFSSGEVMIFDPRKGTWSQYARGLQTPLGLVEDDDGALVVMQWAELTRLRDTDGDGMADDYQAVSDDFGISGNYHEFAYGPVKDEEGNYYVSLNVASNFAGTFKNVRGEFSQVGLAEETMKNWKELGDEWPKIKADAGRMYSRVPYRGCVLKITPDGKSSVFAYGFRSPDGLGFDEEGRLWVTDNQGDWRGTSPLYHVQEDGFYGHPASLVWKPEGSRNPLEIPVAELDAMRTRAAGLFPHGELANSPTQPIPTIDPSQFGLPRGELLIGEMNQPTLVRFLDDEVDGFVQGTMIPFLTGIELGIGNHRLAFDEAGALWMGKIHLGWAGDEGLTKVTWNGITPFVIDGVKLQERGFAISFNQPLGKALPRLHVSRHTYTYHKEYGSPKVDLQDVDVAGMTVSADRRTMTVTLPWIDRGYLYTLQLDEAVNVTGDSLMGDVLRYHVVNTIGDDAATHSDQPFVDLLVNDDMSAWRPGDKEGEWTLKDGVLSRGEVKAGSLNTKEKYQNFDLRFEWKISEGGNSGVIYRINNGRGLEYQLLDDENHIRGQEPLSSSAAIYDIVEPKGLTLREAGEWNTARIVADGNHIEHWLNGVKVLETEFGSADWTERFLKSKNAKVENYGEGGSQIQIQDHGADVSLRNVRIRQLR